MAMYVYSICMKMCIEKLLNQSFMHMYILYVSSDMQNPFVQTYKNTCLFLCVHSFASRQAMQAGVCVYINLDVCA